VPAELEDVAWSGVRRHVEMSADRSAWAVVSTPLHPSVDEANPGAVRWRDLVVDPDLGGLVPGRARPAQVLVHTSGPDSAPWRLPVRDVVGCGLAWHPRRPLVAGLSRVAGQTHPWIADYRARTTTEYPRVRVTTSLTGLGGPPVAWGAAGRLLVLTPAERGRRPVPDAAAYEAVGPGFVAFEPLVGELAAMADAHVSSLDPAGGVVTPLTPPLLVRRLVPSPSGCSCLVEHVDADSIDLRFTHSVLAATTTTTITDRLEPVGDQARWHSGGPDVLTWRTDAARGSAVHLRRVGGGKTTELLVEHEPDEVVEWWPTRHDDHPSVLSLHADGLRLTTRERVLDLLPDAVGIRLGAPVARTSDRLVFASGHRDGRRGLVVVTSAEAGVRTAWASGRHQQAWAVDDGRPGLVVRDGGELHRFELRGARLVPDRPPVPLWHDAAPPAAPPARVVPVRDNAALTLLSTAADDGAALLWLRIGSSAGPDVDPHLAALAGERAVAVLDLALDWPSDATPDSLRPQILDPVRAALDVLSAHERVVVGGHSFGATVALYALAHVPRLAAGIAHSGCYNRTLTATGFHYEKRSYWSAPEMYHAFSALHFADRLDRPVLVVHGAKDANPATTPDQAVDFYRGLVAAGGHARMVLLPEEGHNFRFRESQRRLLAEHRSWLRRSPHAVAGR
jgi:predicted esterase